jgi:hypothetical protein
MIRPAEARDPEVFERWPDEPADASKVVTIFERCGLPSRLD